MWITYNILWGVIYSPLLFEYNLVSIWQTIVIALLFARIDADVLNAGYRFKGHATRWVLRAITIVAVSCESAWLFFLNVAIFYLIFDYALNLMRNLPMMYVGTTAYTDRILNRPITQLIFKIVLFLTTLILFVCKL